MNGFLTRLDNAVAKTCGVVLLALFSVPVLINSDWSFLGVLVLIWGLLVCAVVLFAAVTVIAWVMDWLFR